MGGHVACIREMRCTQNFVMKTWREETIWETSV